MTNKTIVTHNGNFHADDVFSVAALKSIFPTFNLIRTRNVDVIAKADIVIDVGGEYDVLRLRDEYVPIIRLHQAFNHQADCSKLTETSVTESIDCNAFSTANCATLPEPETTTFLPFKSSPLVLNIFSAKYTVP